MKRYTIIQYGSGDLFFDIVRLEVDRLIADGKKATISQRKNKHNVMVWCVKILNE